ncbi:MAG: sensor histidine kinase [Lachnospiraceae bacterium]|nr:sensor histidine kinase [Lachnospiraceae bacterium]
MGQWIVWVLDILLYLAEGYCIQFFFGRFAKPKLHGLKYAEWASGITWIAVRAASEGLFLGMGGGIRFLKLLVSSMVLFVFCMCWYQGNLLLKIFLAVQFAALRELSFWASSSLLFLGNGLITLLAHGADSGWLPIGWLVPAVSLVSYVSVALEWAVQGLLLFVSVRRIAACYQGREEGWMGKEVFLYLLPAAAGLLVDLLVSLLIITAENGETVILYEKYPFLYILVPMLALSLILAVVFGFQTFQELAALQEGRAEKIILEHQITQMQEAMAELEHMYDGVRAVRHDMKNHMAVLQSLIQKKCRPQPGEDEEITQYFAGLCQSVEQLDSRVHTGNAVSDTVVGSKFRYAREQIPGIRLDAENFLFGDAPGIKAYDLGVILNNGLDNAIEACARMREKEPEAEAYIAIRSFQAKQMLFFEIENSFDGIVQVPKGGGFPLSSKEDRELHGIGLKNIQKCAAKYGGDIDCIVEHKRFTLSVMVKGRI